MLFALPILFFGTLARTPVAAVLDPALMLGFGVVVLSNAVTGVNDIGIHLLAGTPLAKTAAGKP